MEISVVVPTYNRRDILLRTLATLFAQDLSPSNYEVIVVIDGSTDGTAEALARLERRCGFRVMEQENRGPSAARNAGFRAAMADLVLFLDDDMQCDRGLLTAHLRAHENSPDTVAFGALFLSEESRKNLASECFRREIGAMHLKLQNPHEDHWQITDCVFSNSSIRKDLLQRLNGFDERFRKREDLEFGFRIFETGAQPKYVPQAIARQYYDKTSADLIREAEAFATADVLLALEHPGERIEGHVLALAHLPPARRFLNGIAARAPWLVDLLLSPLCVFGEAFFSLPFARDLGVRALQFRRKAHWLSRVVSDPRLPKR